MKFSVITNPLLTPDAEFDYLESQLEPGLMKTFRVELTEDCTPSETSLAFYRSENGYCIRFTTAVIYTGSDPLFAALCEEPELCFASFSDVKDYLRSIQTEPGSENRHARLHRMLQHEMPETARAELKLTEHAARGVRKLDPARLKADIVKIVRGQDEAVSRVVRYACASAAKQDPLRPYSILIAGGTGQGKTLLGKTLALAMNEQISDRAKHYGTIVVHCNELTENHDVSRLTGGSPNYVGYGDENVLSPIHENPYQIVVFDEIEKAAPRILDVLMSVLDCGELLLAKPIDGKSVLDLRHCILLFTTNMRLRRKQPKLPIGFAGTADPKPQEKEDLSKTYRNALVAHGMRREIAARFTEIVCFSPLKEDTVIDIILQSIQNCAYEYGIRIGFVTPEIVQSVYDCVDAEGFGARMVNRIVSEQFDLFFAEHAETCSSGSYALRGEPGAPVLHPMQEAEKAFSAEASP